MDVDTVCTTLRDSVTSGDEAGTENCLRYIKDNFSELTQKKRTRELSKELLVKLISADDLRY